MSETIDEMVRAYRRVRDALKAEEAAHEERVSALKEDLETIGQGLLQFCNEQNLDSIRTPDGTVSRRIQTRYWTSDWDQMYQFILDNDMPQLLEKRINSNNMAQYLEDHPDSLPVGLQIDRKYIVQVRKPTNK